MNNNRLQKYQKLDKLGQGTYGVVHKAKGIPSLITDNQTGHYVALKQIQLKNEEQGIPSTALRQISILKQLNHPNIVKLEDIIHSNKKLVLVFEYVEYDLKKYMSNFKETGMNLNLIKLLCYQLLKGIQHCHDKKILHRDLKPQNLLISSNDVLKIADFGLARSSGIPTKGFTSEVVTLWYRPPDVLLGSQNYTDTIDIWSVGCILTEMITMRPLFPGQNQQNELLRIFQMLGTPTSKTWPGVTELPNWNKYKFPEQKGSNLHKIWPQTDKLGLDLVEKMLELNPEKRITAEQCLIHKFFDDIPKEKLQIYH